MSPKRRDARLIWRRKVLAAEEKMARHYCDLVMKGGITSGLVYPTAAIALAREYTFKNVGGTSAGAIAAAACAAAALGQRRKELQPEEGDRQKAMGFDGLGAVAKDLTSKGFIYNLFQPSAGVRPIYRLLVAAAAKTGLRTEIDVLLRPLAWRGGLIFLVAFLPLLAFGYAVAGGWGLLAAFPASLLVALVAALVVVLVLPGVRSGARAAGTIRDNQMGVCSGMRPQGERDSGTPALTEWLHDVIQSLSGQPAGDPLRFEHLWNAERYPGEPDTHETLTLRVITTSVSHHEPRSLPIPERGGTFWFLPEEFRQLFPEDVVQWMMGYDPDTISWDGKDYYRLPREGALPVIVAARMSLSFPFLVSAVPLHEPDFRKAGKTKVLAKDESATRARLAERVDELTGGGARDEEDEAIARNGFRICWFSDGGISSNFPIHLFDAPLPRWPTFAIDLVYSGTEDAAEPEIEMRPDNAGGWARRYFPIAKTSAVAELLAFGLGIIGTMQNWRDLLLSRAPGYRGRIVSVPLKENEGGMNLDMPEKVLLGIAEKGKVAGEIVLRDFKFDCHWWTRWRNVAASSEYLVIAFARGAQQPVSGSYADAYASAVTGKPKPPCYPLSAKQNAEGQMRFATLAGLGAAWDKPAPSMQTNAPRPQPYMTISPVY
jgi:hypothetical protein